MKGPSAASFNATELTVDMSTMLDLATEHYMWSRFNLSFKRALEVLDLWDEYDLQFSHEATRLRGEALLLAYKSSVASTKSTLRHQLRALRLQRHFKVEAERTLDASLPALQRIRFIANGPISLRWFRNKQDNREHDMVPRRLLAISKKKPLECT